VLTDVNLSAVLDYGLLGNLVRVIGNQASQTNPFEGVEFTDALSRIVDLMLHHELPDNESVVDDFIGHEFRNLSDTLQVTIEQFSHKLVSDHIGPHLKLRPFIALWLPETLVVSIYSSEIRSKKGSRRRLFFMVLILTAQSHRPALNRPLTNLALCKILIMLILTLLSELKPGFVAALLHWIVGCKRGGEVLGGAAPRGFPKLRFRSAPGFGERQRIGDGKGLKITGSG
jgi:hypothetical protein